MGERSIRLQCVRGVVNLLVVVVRGHHHVVVVATRSAAPDSKEVLVGKWQLWWVLVAVGVPMAAERNC